ncbi:MULTISPECIES: exonuclease subunit SbcC [unclassified Staphylococcus]|uniref:exonuclease subunit SbcC n=1 Tax=unclassified Staphylococcus TaxID=91994 RepID=UPI0021D235FB|nr:MULTISPECIES: exonuclease subunit SbcC [unclassified Staphylococcus]UXR79167.1 SMC family ATPase [Staphylococcus sp. IVB6227]UXR81736.1 SMC family ATPase [Staphylococcus sp. IVB6214]
MKPIRLHLENFGPFVQEEIDFSKIHDNQLFLISGKTGSGKTMIFDGIVFALYGRASTEKREVKHLRSQFADPNEPLKVTYEFEVRGRRYKVIRTAPYVTPDNQQVKHQTIEVYAFDGTTYHLEESKNRESKQYLLDLINLEHEQFRQLFILPQGEFKRFLISSTKEKQPILRTLFNTQLYEFLNDRLVNNTKDIKIKIANQQEKIKDKWQTLETFDHEALQTYQMLSAEQYDRLFEVLPEYQLIGEQIVKNLDTETKQLNKRTEAVKAELEQQRKRLELEEKYEQILEEIKVLESEKTQIQKDETLLQRIRESKSAIRLYRDQTNEEAQLSEYDKQMQRLENALDQAQQEMSQLDRKEVELSEQSHAIEEKREFVRKTHYFYENHQQFIKYVKNEKERKKEIEVLVERLAQYETKVTNLHKQTGEQVIDIDKEKDLFIQIEQLKRDVDDIAQAEEKAKEASRLKEEIKKIKYVMEDLNEKVMEKTQQIVHLTSHDHTLLNHESAVDVLRSELHLGEPCPVCQQIVHELAEGASMATLKEQRHQNEQLEQEINKLKEQINDCKIHLSVSEAKYESVSDVQFDSEKLQSQKELLEETSQTYQELHDTNKKLEKTQKQLADLKQLMNGIEQEIAVKKEQLARDIEALAEFEQKTTYTDVQQFVYEYEQQSQAVEGYDKALAHQQQERQKREKQVNDITSQRNTTTALMKVSRKKIQQLQSELDVELERLNLDGVHELERVMKEVDKEAEIEARIKKHNEMYHVKLDHQKELSKQIQAMDVKDLTELEHKYEEINNKHREYFKQLSQAQLKLDNNERSIEMIEQEIIYLKEQLDQQRELVFLSDVIKGNNDKKLSLENYVLTYYLDQILLQANKRLLNMTGDRYQLVRKEEKGKGYSGLEIDVFDYYANQSRPINSLSGGETFQASLALALGLCEIVQNEQGGISLDAMFIDEGFGTLDQETLETALDTLIQLQSSGRLVGVISHVTELKERIPVVLEVVSNNYQSHTQLVFRE